MALINCPKCGKEITTQAEACPNCGYPVNTTTSIISEKHSKSQKRMIALALPIGIMAILRVFFEMFCFFKLSGYTLWMVIKDGTLLTTLVLCSLLLTWFVSLFRGSVKKSKMRSISLAACIGIILFLINSLILIRVFVGTEPFWWYNIGLIRRKIQIPFFLNWILFGGVFWAIAKSFHDNLHTYAILVASAFLFKWIIVTVSYIVNLPPIIMLCISVLSYLFMALLFFGFSKTNKS